MFHSGVEGKCKNKAKKILQESSTSRLPPGIVPKSCPTNSAGLTGCQTQNCIILKRLNTTNIYSHEAANT